MNHTTRYAYFFAGILLGSSSLCFAEAVLSEANTYQNLQTLALAHGQDLSKTLIVLDDDNTLTTLPCKDEKNLLSCQYIGGTAWGIWQGNLPKDAPARVATEDSQIYAISGSILGLSQSTLTESDIPDVLKNLTDKGAKIIIETARDPNTLNATQAQLSKLRFDSEDTFQNFINRHGLASAENGANLAGTYYPCHQLKYRKVRYEEGVYYLAGQNKGEMLQCLFQDLHLSAINPPITQIIFMDDTPQNARDVFKYFKNRPDFQVTSIIYHGMDEHRDAFLSGDSSTSLQEKATADWKKLNDTIKKAVAKPMV